VGRPRIPGRSRHPGRLLPPMCRRCPRFTEPGRLGAREACGFAGGRAVRRVASDCDGRGRPAEDPCSRGIGGRTEGAEQAGALHPGHGPLRRRDVRQTDRAGPAW